MPVDPRHYPEGWRDFSNSIRLLRAKGVCECTGECGLHPPRPFIRRCTERHHTRAQFFRGLVRLTVHHTCSCSPRCLNPAHVKAMCQRCHLRCDIPLHSAHRRARRERSAPSSNMARTALAVAEPVMPAADESGSPS